MALQLFRLIALLYFVDIGQSFDVFLKNETDFVDTMVRNVMKCRNIPGMGVTIIRGGQSYYQAYGLSRLDPPVYFTIETPIYLASSGKAFTSALLGVLMTKKKSFNWDTKLSAVFGKDFHLSDRFLQSEMTIRDLLAHRTGLMDSDVYTGVPKIGRKEYLRRLKYLPKIATFRDSWIYNNLLYAIAGHVAEVKEGGKFEYIISRDLLKPLDLFQAECGAEIYPNSSQTNYALPYHYKKQKLKVGNPLAYQIGDVGPAGCITASTVDLGKWVKFMISGGRTVDGFPLVSPDLFKDIIQPQAKLDAWSIGRFNLDSDYPVRANGTWYGLGWYGGYYRGHKKVFHPGNWYGYSSVVGFFPDKMMGFALAVNGPWYSNYRNYLAPLTYALSDLLLGEKQWLDPNTTCSFPAPWKGPSTASNSSSQQGQSTVSGVSRYVGEYGHRIFGTMKIREIESQKLSFKMNSAGIGNLTVSPKANHSFTMMFDDILDDVADSSCHLKFESFKDGKFQTIIVICFWTNFQYSRGVNFTSPEPITNTAGQFPQNSFLLYCFAFLLSFLCIGRNK